jgi:hypothetical protein
MGRNFAFFVLSDLHCTETTGGRRIRNVSDISSYVKKYTANYKAVLIAGDLTDGSDSSTVSYKQCQQFIGRWYTPITKLLSRYSGSVRACLGNHDAPTGGNKKPQIVKFLKDNIGDPNYYSFDIEDIHFACVYLHPSHSDLNMFLDTDFFPKNLLNSLAWLESDLISHRNSKIVLFWHYDIYGPMSDWWENWEKSLTYNLIKTFNIVHVFCGHSHNCFSCYWGNIKVTCVGSGNPMVVASVTKGELSVKYYDVTRGTHSTWESKLLTQQQMKALPVVSDEKVIPK